MRCFLTQKLFKKCETRGSIFCLFPINFEIHMILTQKSQFKILHECFLKHSSVLVIVKFSDLPTVLYGESPTSYFVTAQRKMCALDCSYSTCSSETVSHASQKYITKYTDCGIHAINHHISRMKQYSSIICPWYCNSFSTIRNKYPPSINSCHDVLIIYDLLGHYFTLITSLSIVTLNTFKGINLLILEVIVTR